MTMTFEKSTLRNHIRHQRQQLNTHQCDQTAQCLLKQIQNTHFLQAYQHLAFYWANDHEVDPIPILHFAAANNKYCYLPVITHHQRTLQFVRYQPDDVLQKNRYGIPEPISTPDNIIAPHQLDVVFVPLVAFDQEGNRLGMGAGYYDTTFAFRKNNSVTTPLLVGLAYSLQYVEQVPIDPWDITLDVIMTEKQIIIPKR